VIGKLLSLALLALLFLMPFSMAEAAQSSVHRRSLLRFDKARAEMNAVTSADPDQLEPILRTEAPWVCDVPTGKATNLNALAATQIRALSLEWRQNFSELQEGAAAARLSEAIKHSSLTAIGRIALDYRFTPSGIKAGLLASTQAELRAEWVTAGLFLRGVIRDWGESVCQKPESILHLKRALRIFQRAGFHTDFEEAKRLIALCEAAPEKRTPLSPSEPTGVVDFRLTSEDAKQFIEVWRENDRFTPESNAYSSEGGHKAEVPLVLKLALTFGADAEEAQALFLPMSSGLSLCGNIEPPSQIEMLENLVAYPQSDVNMTSYPFSFLKLSQEIRSGLVSSDLMKLEASLRAMSSLRAGGKYFLPELFAVLKNRPDAIGVAEALAHVGEEALCMAVSELTSAHLDYRQRIVYAIGAFGEKGLPAVPSLVAMLKAGPPAIEPSIEYALASMGPRVIDRLLPFLDVPELQLSIVRVFTQMKAGATSAIDRLLELLEDPAAPHAEIADCLSGMSAEAVPRLTKSLEHRFPHVRLVSAEALAKIGLAARNATGEDFSVPTRHSLRALERLALNSEEAIEARVWAIQALGQIGPLAVPTLEKGLRDPSRDIQIAAMKNFGDVGIASEPFLIGLLASGTSDEKSLAALALLQIRFPTEDAIHALVSAERDKNLLVHLSAKMVLDKLEEAFLPARNKVTQIRNKMGRLPKKLSE
jgi:HEAT repeat protein